MNTEWGDMFESAPTADQWQRQYEHMKKDRDHWREMYQASFDLNAELINGLDRARAQAWDLGWRAREYGHPQTANPYRSDA